MSKNSGKRRVDEDAVKEVASSLDLPELNEQQQKIVDAQTKLHERAEIAVDIATQKIMQPIYAARREAVKSLPRFWGTALSQHAQLAVCLAGQDDMKALSHLTDLWVEHDQVEPRAFTIHFGFSENPYFSDKTLKKEYKYTPPAGTPAPGTNVDANGVSDAQEVFDWELHITPQAIKINWKDDAHNLTKLSPLIFNPEDPDDVEELGSFFNWFEHGRDISDIGPTIVQDVFPQALQYYRGEGEMSRVMADSDEDVDSDEEEDDDDDEEEIDLEQPRKKKAKRS
ncbi:template-activating factor I [Rhizoctonia solani]|uniref:Template-activating factor I n=1 Tax=Rhizoctonia solani TaxID=456999 RepID=A0A0K6FXV9_9AGAM|nr:template-activating factor I [Rhizoctonia solani]